MKTILINGSPNGRKGNSEIFCRKFIQSMANPPEIRYAVEEDPGKLAADLNAYDHWLFFFPLYVNAMPGILKRLFEHLQPSEEKKVGYFIQSGFEEAFQSDWLCELLKNFNRRMGYGDLGIVVAGGMAGVRYMPERMNKKTFSRLEEAGTLYEQHGAFHPQTIQQFGKLHRYSQHQLKRMQAFKKLGLTDVFWNGMLKQNNAYHKRLDQPFAPQKGEAPEEVAKNTV